MGMLGGVFGRLFGSKGSARSIFVIILLIGMTLLGVECDSCRQELIELVAVTE